MVGFEIDGSNNVMPSWLARSDVLSIIGPNFVIFERGKE
jgi:hypothetical protein